MTPIDFDGATLPWVDRQDFPAQLQRRIEAETISEEEAGLLRSWHRDGFLHLPRVIEEERIEALLEEYEQGWNEPPEGVSLLAEGRGVTSWSEMVEDGGRPAIGNRHYRVLDFQDRSEAARDLMLHPRVLRMLRLIFEDTPVAMQSLFFEYGSEQHAHQDFPYVQANILSHLVGCWFACEDAGRENGALLYYPGSHRIPKHAFPGTGLRWDGVHPEHVEEFEAYLPKACAEMGLEPVQFEAEKGDVLLWHAALVHAGSPVEREEATRKSFVVHYSSLTAYPRDRRAPDREPRRIRRNGGQLYLVPPPPSPWDRLKERIASLLGRG